MIDELGMTSEEVGPSINIREIKVLSPDSKILGYSTLEQVEKYIYLPHTLNLGKANQIAETNRVHMIWAATDKLGFILKDFKVPIKLKREVFNVYTSGIDMQNGDHATNLHICDQLKTNCSGRYHGENGKEYR
ncbi:hypothetical protein Trydic_g10826 [Trypoxylus dichotomus]